MIAENNQRESAKSAGEKSDKIRPENDISCNLKGVTFNV